MATWQVVNSFTDEIGEETHKLSTDTLKIGLTNTAPSVTNTVWGNITEIAAGNGYTAGGTALTGVTYTQTGGTATLAFSTDLTFTATGGAIAQFQYPVLYNDTAANDELIAFFNHGAAVDLANGESYTISAGTIFTLAQTN